VRVISAVAFVVLLAAGCVHRLPAFDPPRGALLSCRQVLPATDHPPAWITPSDLNDRLRLSRWCETVGPVFFQPRPAAVTAPVDRLAIVSWNIHEGDGDVDDFIRRLRLGEFTGGDPIEAFVLLLQEATRRDGTVPLRVPRGYPVPRSIAPHRGVRDGGVTHLANEGLAVLYAPSMRNGGHASNDGAEDRGNAIVSTLPLLEPRIVELPLEHQRRVTVAATVEGRTRAEMPWHLDLVNVHLDTALALLRGGPFAARARQVRALLDALDSFPPPAAGHDAIVIAGDLNTWRGAREPAVRILRDAFPDTPPADHDATWHGPLRTHATLDHIFVRGAVSPSRVTRLPGRFGSDHFPLLTIVRFSRN
jgi:endonuclease/exonuclease/phosphatase family metal-dependent hydrolase